MVGSLPPFLASQRDTLTHTVVFSCTGTNIPEPLDVLSSATPPTLECGWRKVKESSFFFFFVRGNQNAHALQRQ